MDNICQLLIEFSRFFFFFFLIVNGLGGGIPLFKNHISKNVSVNGDTMNKTEKAMASHSRTLAWKIPWMEGPGGLQSMGSLGVGHD